MDYVCPRIRAFLKENRDYDMLQRSINIGTSRVSFQVGIVRRGSPTYDLESILDYCTLATEIVSSLAWSSSNVTELEVTLWLTPFRKTWCVEQGVDQGASKGFNSLGVCEVNSGETRFIGFHKRQITVWRAEDWSKVLLHELFHAFDWDRLVPSTPDNQSEALVEAMATLVHCQLLGGREWPSILTQERVWMLRQVCALTSNPWQANKTSVTSYYLLKASLLYNDAAMRRLKEWLQSKTEQDCRKSWDRMVQRQRDALSNYISSSSICADPFWLRSCVPMRMVYYQLSLHPKPK